MGEGSCKCSLSLTPAFHPPWIPPPLAFPISTLWRAKLGGARGCADRSLQRDVTEAIHTYTVISLAASLACVHLLPTFPRAEVSTIGSKGNLKQYNLSLEFWIPHFEFQLYPSLENYLGQLTSPFCTLPSVIGFPGLVRIK